MPVTNSSARTQIDEIGEGLYRIHTPVGSGADAFSYNQYLLVDEEPLLYHSGPRKMFGLVREAVAAVLPPEKLRHIAFSHFENDESGCLNEWLALAPGSVPLCGRVNGIINAGAFDRPPKALADGEALSLGRRRVVWFDTPHLPHGWECGHLYEETTKTLFCGDLFTQGGEGTQPLTGSDILGPSEAMRKKFDYYAHSRNDRPLLEKLARLEPTLLACMHGSAWNGDGGALLRALGKELEA